jgi:hypothetical protein
MNDPKAPPYKAPAGYVAPYRALKVLKRLKHPDGVYRDVMPGQDAPGAESWPNPYLWVKRGFIERKDGAEVKWGEGAEYQPPVPVTDAHLKKVEKDMQAWEQNGTPDPPVWGKSQIGPGKDQEPAVRDPDDAEIDAALAKRPKAKPVDPKKLAKLQAMSKAKLVKLANSLQGDGDVKMLKINGVEDKNAIIRKLMEVAG